MADAYYKVVYGYQMAIVKLDYPTTDYGAIVDILVDNLEKEGVGEPYLLPLDKAEEELNEDEYVVAGNHGLALVHNGNFMVEPISEQDAKQYNKDDHIEIYEESKQVKENTAMDRIDAMVKNILEGKDITETLVTNLKTNESADSRLISVKIVDEPYGKGIEVKDSNGAIYRYAVDEHDPVYYTPEKVLHAVQAIARRNNYDMTKIYSFLRKNTLGDYDKDISGRTGLASAEIVAEPNGDGLKITLDNGKVFRYTVDTNDENYDTLDKLKAGAEGMWRHQASVDGIIKFLDNHAILYAREGVEFKALRQELNQVVRESDHITVKLGWVEE